MLADRFDVLHATIIMMILMIFALLDLRSDFFAFFVWLTLIAKVNVAITTTNSIALKPTTYPSQTWYT